MPLHHYVTAALAHLDEAIHGQDPAHVDSYTPMCKSCHMKYDLGPERVG